MTNEKKSNFVVILIAMVILLAFAFIYFQNQQLLTEETTTSDINKSLFPEIQSKINHINSVAIQKGLMDGNTEIDQQVVELIHGYPSIKTILKQIKLPSEDIIMDKKTGHSVLIKNGDCLISITEATETSPPEVIDMFSNCQ
ncbi:MAG TPA: hypothetical protein ENJ60_01705 [Aeromonadales bacterium]|nr:hypothetical protein [Aeromonadales bacterium]